MTNLVQATGQRTRGFFARMLGIWGPLSSLIFAFAIYITFWDGFVTYEPNLNTAKSAMREIFIVAAIAQVYLIIQMTAVVTRHTGRVWEEVNDLVFSLIPLFFIVTAVYDRQSNMIAMSDYELAVAILFGIASAADVIVVTVSAFKLLLMANDMFVSN